MQTSAAGDTPEYRRQVRKAAVSSIPKSLEEAGGKLATREIHAFMKQHYPALCDDSIACHCRANANHPVWDHQVDWALQALKKSKVVDKAGRGFWMLKGLAAAPGGNAPQVSPAPHAQGPPAAPAPQPVSYAPAAGARSELQSLTERVRSLITSGEGRRLSEADTRALFIDPYLRLLGYVDFEDVRREYFVKDLKEYMDYLLYVDGAPTIALEAKALGADLTDPMAAQLVKYAAIEGIEWCLLTNARQFFVYNQYLKGTVCDKLVLQLDVLAGQTQEDREVAFDHLWLLSKDNVRHGGLTGHMDQFKLDRAIREILLEPGNVAVKSIRAELRRRFSLQASQDAIAAWVREHLAGL
jgi:hypothetical protein